MRDAQVNRIAAKKPGNKTRTFSPHKESIRVSGAIQPYSPGAGANLPAGTMNQMFRPPPADQRPALETLAGTVERVTFHNAENGFAVPKVHNGDQVADFTIRLDDRLTVTKSYFML